MRKVFMIVCTHKKASVIAEDSMYHFVVGGASIGNTGNDGSYLDNELEDNISAKNPFYCELTALYWGWKKNIDAELIGLSHYRRYFYSLNDQRCGIKGNHILTSDDCLKIFQQFRAIMPCYDTRPVLAVKELRKRNDKPYYYAETVIKEHYINMLSTYKKVAYGYKMAYGNMMVVTKEDFIDYCSWLFDVLQRVDELMSTNGDTIIPRMEGFLSETLLNVWILHKYKEQEVYRMPIIRAESREEAEQTNIKMNRFSYVHFNEIKRKMKQSYNYMKYLINKS